MASATFLELVNRLLNALNEVELDSSSFSSTVGFHTEAKNCINQGLFDVYAHENVNWPFLFGTLSFDTTIGQINYSKDASVIQGSVDWQSFRIKRAVPTVSSITQSAGVATVTTSGAHNFKTGDSVAISGADQSGYNIENAVITVTGSTTFTYTVASSTVSPATGTLVCKSNTVQFREINFRDWEEYRDSIADTVENMNVSAYATPCEVTRTRNENFIIYNPADRVYTINYDAFVMPTKLVLYTDTHLIPEQWEQAIVEQGKYHAYMFRDNMEQAKIAEDKGQALIRQMRKALVPVQKNVHMG